VYAVALADLAAAAQQSNLALAAALDAEKKPAKRQQLEKTASSMFQAAMVQPFVDAAVQGSVCSSPALAPLYQDVCTALVLGWSHYVSRLNASGTGSAAAATAGPDALVALALRAIAMLEACSKAAIQAAAQAPPHVTENIGACLAGEASSSQFGEEQLCGYFESGL
jgi:glycogen debranching enzyme